MLRRNHRSEEVLVDRVLQLSSSKFSKKPIINQVDVKITSHMPLPRFGVTTFSSAKKPTSCNEKTHHSICDTHTRTLAKPKLHYTKSSHDGTACQAKGHIVFFVHATFVHLTC
ncbi:hypothetical protein ACLOJK_007266 [Asimina triloba]